MRFQNTASRPFISDGPHRIDQTAAWPGQVLIPVPAFDVAKAIVVDAQPLVSEVPTAIKFPEIPEPADGPPPAPSKGQ